MLSQDRYQYTILFILIPFQTYTHPRPSTLVFTLKHVLSKRRLRQSSKTASGLAWPPTGSSRDQKTNRLPDSSPNSLAGNSNNKSLHRVSSTYPPVARPSALPVQRLITAHIPAPQIACQLTKQIAQQITQQLSGSPPDSSPISSPAGSEGQCCQIRSPARH